MPLLISIAGSDPGRGAGLQMDARVCWRMGVQFRGVVAVDTVQDDGGLQSVTPRRAEQVADELRAALAVVKELDGSSPARMPGLAVKTGALGNEKIVRAVASVLAEFNQQSTVDGGVPLVVDPVRAATKNLGAQLLNDSGWQTMKEILFPIATLVTPNTLEYADGSEFRNCRGVLLKGGHRVNADPKHVRDELWLDGKLAHQVVKPMISGATDLHGTGCALSTAIAVELASGKVLIDSVIGGSNQCHQWLERAVQACAQLLSDEEVSR
jgi:hydroxymethylpyrimidine/phosphomethylpyrimidine kinase